MRPATTGAGLLAGALMCSVLAACGGSASSVSPQAAEAGAVLTQAADLSTCSADASAAATPYGDGFPEDWPFPPASVVFNVEDRGADGTIVTAVSSTDLAAILDFMNGHVVDAGFVVEKGETEDHDAEAEWDGNGFRGRWSIRESAACPGDTVVQVLSAAD